MNKNTRTWKILTALNHHADADIDSEKEENDTEVLPSQPDILEYLESVPASIPNYEFVTEVTPGQLENESDIFHLDSLHLQASITSDQEPHISGVQPENLPHDYLYPESPQPFTSYTVLQNVKLTDKNHETVKVNSNLLHDLYVSDSDDCADGTDERGECILSESSSFNISSPSVPPGNIVAEQAEISSFAEQEEISSFNTSSPSVLAGNVVAEQAEMNTIAASGTESLLPGYQNRKRKRKGQANPKEWKKNERKIKRQKGEPYLTAKGVLKPGKSVGEKVCTGFCKEKCPEKISEEDRLTIFSSFWNIENVEQKRQYIVSLIKQETPKTRKTANPESRRKLTNKYFLKKPTESEPVKVCQKFFLSTFNVSEMFVRGCFKKLSETNVVESDARGVFSPHNKTPESARQFVKNHINSFPRMPAHYVRKDTKKEYLDQDLNVTKMYELYVDKCKEDDVEPLKINMYRDILNKDFNIGFHKPRNDMCDECFAYDNMNDEEKEAKRDEHEAHLQRKVQARRHRDEAKKLALDDEIHFAEYDMEAICHIPTSSSKKIFYKRRLPVYNCTLLDFGKEKREVTCYCWNEGVGNKGANEVGSSLFKYMTEKADGKPITFMSDTCASQCRNMYISALITTSRQKYTYFGIDSRCVTFLDIPEINQKYFEPGHSQMEVDNIHANIELAKKSIPIFDPSSYYTIIRTASRRNPFKVQEMGQEDFFDLKKLKTVMIKNCKTDTNGETANWLKIKWLQYRKNDPEHIYFKYDLDSDHFNKIKVFRRGNRAISSRVILQKAYSGPIAISTEKYNDLQELCRSGVIPSTYHDFYNNLRVDRE